MREGAGREGKMREIMRGKEGGREKDQEGGNLQSFIITRIYMSYGAQRQDIGPRQAFGSEVSAEDGHGCRNTENNLTCKLRKSWIVVSKI